MYNNNFMQNNRSYSGQSTRANTDSIKREGVNTSSWRAGRGGYYSYYPWSYSQLVLTVIHRLEKHRVNKKLWSRLLQRLQISWGALLKVFSVLAIWTCVLRFRSVHRAKSLRIKCEGTLWNKGGQENNSTRDWEVNTRLWKLGQIIVFRRPKTLTLRQS